MSNQQYATVMQGYTVGQRMFYRPSNANVTQDLTSAFIPVTVESPLEDGQRYMGGIVFSLCETEWFVNELAKRGLLEDAAEEILTAIRDWFGGADDGTLAGVVIDDICKIVVGYANRMNWVIDLSMSYSIAKAYLDGYKVEMADPERDTEDAQVTPEVKGEVKKVRRGSGHDYFALEVDDTEPAVENETPEVRAVKCVAEINAGRPEEGHYLDFAYFVLETLDRYGFKAE